jgi:hypothetical protein
LFESQKTYEEINDFQGIANTELNIEMVYAILEQYLLGLEQ